MPLLRIAWMPILATQFHASFIGGQESCQYPHGSGLARTVGTQETRYTTRMRFKTKVFKDRLCLQAFTQISNNHRHKLGQFDGEDARHLFYVLGIDLLLNPVSLECTSRLHRTVRRQDIRSSFN